jgi:hypothetical protein
MDSEIMLPMLAERMSIPVHHIPQPINKEYVHNSMNSRPGAELKLRKA